MKFLHIADVHLDSPFTLSDPVDAGKRRNELRSVFCSAILYAKTEGCSLFIISGDLFDDSFVTKDTMEMLVREFSSFPTCHFVIAPGNHDPYNEKSPYALTAWGENVHIFSSESVEFLDIPGTNVRVYGYAFTSDTYKKPPLAGFSAPDDGKIHILAAHGDVGVPLSVYAPIAESDLRASGVTYAALGHIHKASEIKTAGKTTYAYAGCPEGRGFDETGFKGALIGEITESGVSVRPVRLAKKRYEICRVDMTGEASFLGAAHKIVEVCSCFGEDTALRVILEGLTTADFSADYKTLRSLLPHPFLLELKDETLPLYNSDFLKNDNTILGEFYRNLEDALSSGDAKQRETALLAFKYGLRALGGRELESK